MITIYICFCPFEQILRCFQLEFIAFSSLSRSPSATTPKSSLLITPPGSKYKDNTGIPNAHASINILGKPSIGEVLINAFEFAIWYIVSEWLNSPKKIHFEMILIFHNIRYPVLSLGGPITLNECTGAFLTSSKNSANPLRLSSQPTYMKSFLYRI